MADSLRGEGKFMDIPSVIETGTTITAGSMVTLDLSGTGVVRRVPDFTGSQEFVGVLTETLTGDVTGCVIQTEGVFEFSTPVASTGSEVFVGKPVFAADHETVRGLPGAGTASTVTGINPVGVCVLLPEGRDDTATSVRCWVKIYPFQQLPTVL